MGKIWILVAIIAALILFGFREGLEPNSTIKEPTPNQFPPYPPEEMSRIKAMIPPADKDEFVRVVKERAQSVAPTPTTFPPGAFDPLVEGTAVNAIADFYTQKYKSATVPITEADIESYISTQLAPEHHKKLQRAVLKAYYVGQSAPTPAGPTGPTGPTATGPTAMGPTGPPPGTPEQPGANTTGGSSVTNWGGGGGSEGRLWGPPFSGKGTPRNLSGGGAGGDGEYPTLLGPPSDASAYWAGVGVVPPSKNTLLKGSLPSSASLGSDPMSGFLPYSRQPGDQDLIADPYRLSKSYSTSSYSSKNEPVPFLTDFSAFQK